MDFTGRDVRTTSQHGHKGNEKSERAKLYLNRRMSPENSDEDESMIQNNQPSPPKDTAEEADFNDHQVQILELHSENPIISYKGRVYSGRWSQNVGTELLMTRHDDYNPLPALQHLDNDVDLLAASCSRITVEEMEIKPKEGVANQWRQRDANDSSKSNAPVSVVPVPERWATKERIDQGNFLANLIALKKRKGETDEVTVIAKGMDPRNDHNRNRKLKQKEKQNLRRGHRGKYNLPHYRAYRRGGGSELLKTLSIREPLVGLSPTASFEDNVSTPTPNRWDDLEGEDVSMVDDFDMGDDDDQGLGEIGYSGSGGDGGSVEEMDVDDA